jgi:hypothetical protein
LEEHRSNTYERPWLRSASFGCYLVFPDFLIMPIGYGLRHGDSWLIGPWEWALAKLASNALPTKRQLMDKAYGGCATAPAFYKRPAF